MTAPAPPTQQPDTKDPEQAESVDLEHVRHAFEAALAALLLLWLAIRLSWITSLVEQIRAAGRRRGGGRDFPRIAVGKTETGHATDIVNDALTRYAKQAAQHVVDEAALQGQTIDPAEVSPAALETQAAVAVALLTDSLELSAASEAARVHPPEAVIVQQGKDAAAAAHPGGKPSAEEVKKAIEDAREAAANDTASKVEQHLHELTDAQLRYVLGAVLHGAGNEARIATFLGSDEVDLFANETLDANTCGPCFQVHGTLLARVPGDYTLLRRLYPVRGYIDCLGRDRCRGTVVGVWRKPPRQDS